MIDNIEALNIGIIGGGKKVGNSYDKGWNDKVQCDMFFKINRSGFTALPV